MNKFLKILNDFVPDEQRFKLCNIKINSIQRFLEAINNGKAEEIKQTLDINDAELARLKNRAKLFMLDGVRGKTCQLLTEVGIVTIEQFAKEDPDALALKLRETNNKKNIMKINHNRKKIRKMVWQAEMIAKQTSD